MSSKREFDPGKATAAAEGFHLASQFLLKHLTDVLNSLDGDPPKFDEEARRIAWSFTSSGAVLQALAVEVLLKAFLVKLGKTPSDQHNLARLFAQLPRPLQELLCKRYKAKVNKINEGQVAQTEEELPKALRKNAEVFEQWRYMYEKPQGKSLSFGKQSLQIAYETLVEAYYGP